MSFRRFSRSLTALYDWTYDRTVATALAPFFEPHPDGDPRMKRLADGWLIPVEPADSLTWIRSIRSAHAYVLRIYPPHPTERERQLAYLFAIIIRHVAHVYRTRETDVPPQPQYLDIILRRDTDDLLDELVASPLRDVRRHIKHVYRVLEHPVTVRARYSEVQDRYGRRWSDHG